MSRSKALGGGRPRRAFMKFDLNQNILVRLADHIQLRFCWHIEIIPRAQPLNRRAQENQFFPRSPFNILRQSFSSSSNCPAVFLLAILSRTYAIAYSTGMRTLSGSL